MSKYSKAQVDEAKVALKRHQALFRLQLSLLERPQITPEYLSTVCARLLPIHLDEIAEEREHIGKCGYPLCQKPPNPVKARNKVIYWDKERMVNAEEISRFCSLECHDRLDLLKAQLPIGGKNAGRTIEIPLMSTTDKLTSDNVASDEKVSNVELGLALPSGEKVAIVERSKTSSTSKIFPAPRSSSSALNIKEFCSSLSKTKKSENDSQRVESMEKSTEGQSQHSGPLPDLQTNEPCICVSRDIVEDDVNELGVNAIDLNLPLQCTTAAKKNLRESTEKMISQPKTRIATIDAGHTAIEEFPEATNIVEEFYDSNEDTQSDTENDVGQADFGDSSLGFLDLSDMKNALSAFKPSGFMRLVNAISQLSGKQNEEQQFDGVIDEAYASRYRLLSKCLYDASNIILLNVESRSILLCENSFHSLLDKISLNFCYSRAIPSLRSAEWQVFVACLLGAGMDRSHATSCGNSCNDKDSVLFAVECLKRFALSRDIIGKAEIASLINTMKLQL